MSRMMIQCLEEDEGRLFVGSRWIRRVAHAVVARDVGAHKELLLQAAVCD